MAGSRARAFEDLRDGTESKIRPSMLQMLFRGGPARPVASADLRNGRESVKPRPSQMLFRGGPARALAREDLRMDHDGEDGIRPGNTQMLADGGEVDDGLLMASEDILSAFKAGKPQELAKALKAFFMVCESEPHDEADGEE